MPRIEFPFLIPQIFDSGVFCGGFRSFCSQWETLISPNVSFVARSEAWTFPFKCDLLREWILLKIYQNLSDRNHWSDKRNLLTTMACYRAHTRNSLIRNISIFVFVHGKCASKIILLLFGFWSIFRVINISIWVLIWHNIRSHRFGHLLRTRIAGIPTQPNEQINSNDCDCLRWSTVDIFIFDFECVYIFDIPNVWNWIRTERMGFQCHHEDI